MVRNWTVAAGTRREILVYTGFTWAQLIGQTAGNPYHPVHGILPEIDILVDGPYDQGQDDDDLQWRGSRNQRVIDVPRSLHYGAIAVEERLRFLDWDTPTISLSADGQLVGASNLIRELFGEEQTAEIPRCGQ